MNKIEPIVKEITVKELRKVEVPSFQRWIVEKNINQLSESINEIGLQRLPILCYVKEKKKTYIIDGNHIRTILIEKSNPLGLKDSDQIRCIWSEVNNYSDAARIFRFLNTKGKKLDWVDLTNLHMHASVTDSSIYRDMWTIFGAPENHVAMKKYKGFTTSTIINLICKDTAEYREGNGAPAENYAKRKNLLEWLLNHANNIWDEVFGETMRRPTGPAINGFANYWFSKKLFLDYSEQDFINFINEIYKENAQQLKEGTLVINRDNAGRFLENYLSRTLHSVTLD